MASFGKLTDYFNRRKSREELRGGRSARRSGSYCCTVAEARYTQPVCVCVRVRVRVCVGFYLYQCPCGAGCTVWLFVSVSV